MNRESLKRMRFDRRLLHRRGWMSSAETDRALEDLPDVSSKATTLGAVSDQRGDSEKPGADEPTTPGA